MGSRLYVTGGDFQAGGLTSAELTSSLPGVNAGIRITSAKQHACILQLQDVSESSIVDVRGVLTQIAALLRAGQWELDLVTVVGRQRVRRGFAAISQGAGHSLEVGVSANVPLAEILQTGNARLHLARDRGHGGFLLYEFSNRQTPVFLPPIWVKRSLWSRLLPWGRDGSQLVAPDGRRIYPLDHRQLPASLAEYPPQMRLYDPQRSSITPAELANLTIDDMFEEVELQDANDHPRAELRLIITRQDDSASPVSRDQDLFGAGEFPLPVLPSPAALAAANPAASAPLLQATSPDLLIRFYLYGLTPTGYQLEVSAMTEVQLPVIVAVSYSLASGDVRQVLIPVDDGDDDGPPSSVVDLKGYLPGAAWRAWGLADPRRIRQWPADLVAASVRAAVTMATLAAWRRVADTVAPETSALIVRAIRMTWDAP